ncbi:anaphase-promoting complex subunit Apc11 [Suillus paluster]|uniref:anaphase-promoting complex subunit Apc11 n=1 Tax=Suillus paluster TaxID=48578 RepID=UPI001B85C034|nr:anaphase-promoting complex subunit Apc11 [Suillus paluster]KAG1741847.1 anaphase-promoting complex subunit Apc11 [Suillus paluster]
MLFRYFIYIVQWLWNTGNANHDEDDEGNICGICHISFEGCCAWCKIPGTDCPLIWGECSHVFHMHCLLEWLGMDASKQQCPLD